MRVMLLNQYYHPDVAATAQLAADLGAELVRRGHDVVAVASCKPYSGRGELPLKGEHDGVRIVRVGATALGRGSRLLRSLDYGTFLARALWPVMRLERPDVVVALSTPPFVAALALLSQLTRKTKLVYWVMDVYPELAIELGALDPKQLATKVIARLARTLLERADAVVALDEAMRDRLIAGGAAPGRVTVIDNWCDGDEIRPAERAQNLLRQQLGLGDRFTVAYSGNMGLGHDFTTVTEGMALLAGEDIAWLFIGDGPRRAELERMARATGAAHVTFLPYQPRAALPTSLTAADAHLVCLEKSLAGLLVPSKLYAILASGTPVVYVGPPSGRVAQVLRDHEVGASIPNGDARGFAQAVRRMKDDPRGRREQGQRARALFDAQFTRAMALDKHHALIRQVNG